MIHLIDVSDNNGSIDWSQVIIDPLNIKGAICKATEGITFKDPTFLRNLLGARNQGLKIGAYHFYIPDDNPLAQAKNFMSQIQTSYFPMSLILDVEQHPGWDSMDAETISEGLQTWLDYVQQCVKGKPKIYTNKPFIDQYLSAFPLGNYDLWLADYNPTPALGLNWMMWQYSEKGTVKGIQGPVDLNVFNGDDLTPLLIQPG